MIELTKLIELAGVDLGKFKIHCATDNKTSGWKPLDEYYAGKFEEGQSQQSQPNFECDNVLSLINLGSSKRWLFVGVYHVDGFRRSTGQYGYLYRLTKCYGLEHLEGRAIIGFEKSFRNSYIRGDKYGDQLLVESIRDEKLSIADFPGFNSVRLSFDMLSSVIKQDHPSWKAALSNIAGVYVIADQHSGKPYVGSAYGGIGIWQRWENYVKTGHGGNKELRDLLKRKGQKYSSHFQFSLVEVCDITSSPAYVVSRETHWKNVLLSREFGLNWN